MSHVVSFLNNKGGVAKTMTAFNTGMYWGTKLNERVLFIDLDSQANLTSHIAGNDPRYVSEDGGFAWERTLEDAILGSPELTPLPILPTEYPNIDFVPAGLSLSNFDTDVFMAPNKECILKAHIDSVRDKYDFIVMDCPPALGGIVVNAMVASDGIVLVTTGDKDSIEGVGMIASLFNGLTFATETEPATAPNLKLTGIAITREKRDKITQYWIKQISDAYPQYILNPHIKERTILHQASSFRKDIFSYAPDSSSAAEYKELAKDILRMLVND